MTDADHEALPADLLHVRGVDGPQLLHEPGAQLGRPLGKLLLEDHPRAARPTAAPRGLPPKVEPWSPGWNTSMYSRVGDGRRDRVDPAAERLADDEHVGPDVLPVAAEEPARCGPRPVWISSAMKRTPCSVAELPGPAQIALGRHDDAALALERLHEEADRVRR